MTANVDNRDRDGGLMAADAVLPGASLAAGLAALAGASCCALPLILAISGAGGAWVANLAVLVNWRPWIFAVAGAVVAAGWIVAAVRPARPRAFVLLGFATVALGGAFAVAAYEADITRALARLWVSS